MTRPASEINAAYQSLPPAAREFIEHSDDWKTISDVLVEKTSSPTIPSTESSPAASIPPA